MSLHFLQDETGAITVNWTVLSAGIIGLALAATSVVISGTGDQALEIEEFLSDITIQTAFEKVFASDDFSNGRGNWVGGELMTINGFGEILALSGSSSVAQLPINIGDDHPFAVVEFDMIIADSWDNEQGSVSINGTDVLIGTHAWRNDAPVIQTFDGADNTVVTLTRTSKGTGGKWRPGQEDYTYNVRIVAENDGSDLTIGAATTLNQNAGDEFFGIDNVKVKGANSSK